MIHLYSGDGKGKTSIVTGMAMRMAGAGKEVIFAQFMKGNESSEIKIFSEIPRMTVLKVEKNFGFYKDMTESEKAEITGCHNEILRKIYNRIKESAGKNINRNLEPDLLVVMDEITYPCRWNLIDEMLLLQILRELPENVELAMTGRNPQDYMIECSDYWSDVEKRKHPYDRGIKARQGVEY